jgi:hypothetical protein
MDSGTVLDSARLRSEFAAHYCDTAELQALRASASAISEVLGGS